MDTSSLCVHIVLLWFFFLSFDVCLSCIDCSISPFGYNVDKKLYLLIS